MLLGVATVVLLVLPGSAGAQALVTVNTTADGDDGECTPEPAGCTLREAVSRSALDATITLPAGTYALTEGHLQIIGTRRLQGAGARSTSITAGGRSRVFTVDSGVATVSGVRVTGGSAPIDDPNAGSGGGILVDRDAELELLYSSVDGNRAQFGGGIFSLGPLTVRSSTISANESADAVFFGGGGIFMVGSARLANTTVSGNIARSGGGGIFNFGGNLEMNNVTLAGNSSQAGLAGSALLHLKITSAGAEFGETTARNTVIAGNAGVACAGDAARPVWTPVVTDDAACYAVPVDTAGLTDLGNYDGPTDAHALLAGSPAIDAGDPQTCEELDQYDRPRTLGQRCDAGALEMDGMPSATLRVVTSVINDQGGTAGPGSMSVSVKSGTNDVLGSPRPGVAAGRRYLLVPGTYAVSPATVSGYTASVGGECDSGGGTVALQIGEDRTCTVTYDDVAPPQSSPPGGSGGGGGGGGGGIQLSSQDEQLPPPEAGESVNVEPKSGTVRIRLRGARKFVVLDEGRQIPLGTEIDTRKGRITLTAASDRSGGTATADFYGGLFAINQTKGAKPTTRLRLSEKLSCPKGGKANIAVKTRKRRLWGDGKGRFRTEGKYSSATVRRTKWLVEDRCTSTLTRVAKGSVTVRDLVKKRTVVVKAGKTYVAKRKR